MFSNEGREWIQMEKEKMNILISVDDKYIKHAEELINSIVINNNVYLNVYLIYGNELNEKNINELSNYLQKNMFGELHTIYFENETKFPIYIEYISMTTYYRLFAPYMINEKIDRILYLDCDVICNGSIMDFYNSDFEGNAIIGCENIVDPQYIEWKTKINTRIGLPEDYQYINAGVLLINIQEYVNHISIENLYKFIEENGSDLIYQDQDTINKIFCNRIKLANVIYNFQVNTIVDTNNYEEARLIHYAGEQKPWKYDFSTPKKGIFYYDYLKRKNQFRKLKKLLLGQYIHNALKYYDDIVKGENSRRLKNYSKKSCLLLFS